MMHLSRAEAEGFYAVHRERPFFKDLVEFMISGPVMMQVLEGENAIAKNRDLMGATDPKKAAKGTIRADFADSIDANAVHGSDAPETARNEIAYFFPAQRGVSRVEDSNLLDLDAAGLARFFASSGEKPFRARQVLRWIHQRGAARLRRDERPRARACARSSPASARIARAARSSATRSRADGTRKWLLKVDGANAIETVFIPEDEPRHAVRLEPGRLRARLRVLLDRQAGLQPQPRRPPRSSASCGSRTGCCGVERRSGRAIISNVVMMGMGEPLLNLDNVIPALRLMLDDNAYGLSRRRVTVSTSGVVPGMDRLRDECPVALAVSLHAPNDALRDRLVPVNRKYPLARAARGLQPLPREGAARLHHLRVRDARRRERRRRARARAGRRSPRRCAASST